MSAEDAMVKILEKDQSQAVLFYVLAMCQIFEIDIDDVLSLFAISARISFTDEDIASLIEKPLPDQKLPPFSPIALGGIEGGFRVRSRLNSNLFIIIALVVILQISISCEAKSLNDFEKSGRSLFSAFFGSKTESASESAKVFEQPAKQIGWWDYTYSYLYDWVDFIDKNTSNFLIQVLIYENRVQLGFLAVTAFVFLGPLYSFQTIVLFLILLVSQNYEPVRPLEIAGVAAVSFLIYKTDYAIRHPNRYRLPELTAIEKTNLSEELLEKLKPVAGAAGAAGAAEVAAEGSIDDTDDLNTRITYLQLILKELEKDIRDSPQSESVLALREEAGLLPQEAGVLPLLLQQGAGAQRRFVSAQQRRLSGSTQRRLSGSTPQRRLSASARQIHGITYTKEESIAFLQRSFNFDNVKLGELSHEQLIQVEVNLTRSIQRFIKPLINIRDDYPQYLIGPNYLSSITKFKEGVGQGAILGSTLGLVLYNTTQQQQQQLINAAAEKCTIQGGASIYCHGVSFVLAGFVTIVVLVIIVYILSRFIDSFEPGAVVKTTTYEDFVKRVGSFEAISNNIQNIIETMFDNKIYRDLKYLISRLVRNFVRHWILISLTGGFTSVLTTLLANKDVKLKDIFYNIRSLGYNLLYGIYSMTILPIPKFIYILYTNSYRFVLKYCGSFSVEKEIVEIINSGIKVLEEIIPKIPVLSSPLPIKETMKKEDQFILSSYKQPIVLDRTKLKIDPKLYRKLQFRSQPSRKRTASRPSRKRRTASRPSRKRRTASRPSRSRPSRSRTSPRRVKKTSRAKSKRR